MKCGFAKVDITPKVGCHLGLADAYEGYFPTEDAFGVGGYEARTPHFLPGVAEKLVDAGVALLKDL